MTKARDIASAIPAPSTVSSAELGYLDGVSSAIQTQLDAKTAKSTLSTTGDIYYASSANTPARLGIGSTGNVLTVAAGIPSWAAPAGGGKVLQVVSTVKTDSFTTSTGAGVFTDVTGLSVSITPTSATSKILVIASVNGNGQIGGNFAAMQLVRGSTAIFVGDAASSRVQASTQLSQVSQDTFAESSITFLDSPATTSSTTYKIQGCSLGGTGYFYVNRTPSDQNNSSTPRGASSITVMEIGA